MQEVITKHEKFLEVYLLVAPDGVLTYGKSKFALKYSNGKGKECQVVSVTFITTEWFFQLKKILKVFSTSAGGS